VRHVQPRIANGWLVHGNLCALAATAGMDIPVVWAVHQSLYDVRFESLSTRYLLRLSARLSQRPTLIIYASQTSAAHHEALGYSPVTRLVIPNGFDLSRFHPDAVARARIRDDLHIGHDDIVIGLVARFHPMKDHATFIQAAAMIAVPDREVRFVLAGRDVDDSNPVLSEARAQARLEDRMTFLGERADTEQLYAACDIVGLSSYTESFPNVLGEAMACGVPCVTTDVGDCSAIVGDTGRTVPPRDAVAFANALTELIGLDPSARRDLGARARSRIAELFSIDANRARYHEAYGTVLRTSGQREDSSDRALRL
jgi:glycosyltransferase involved in cell wall biosynthesis